LLTKNFQIVAQQYSVQFREHTLQQLAAFIQGKNEQVKALERVQPTPPKMHLSHP